MSSQKRIRSNVTRLDLPEALYFITLVTHNRRQIFLEPQFVELLRTTLREVARHHPFSMRGYVLLPDHLHLLIKLLPGTNISRQLHSLKRNFTLEYKAKNSISEKYIVWQRSFYDHVIRDEGDFQNHLNYIHYNPVKHGIVDRPEMFEHSSYHEYLRRNWYELGWGHVESPYDELDDNRSWGE